MEKNKDIRTNIRTWKLISAIILVNALGLSLRYFNLSTYITLLGFRFHLSFVIPFLIVCNTNILLYLKKCFLNPEYKKYVFPSAIIFLPLLIVAGGLFILQKIDIGDPEYFYEFGISSIADYPIYLIWNIPQMILLFYFLTRVSFQTKFRFAAVASTIFFLFAFEIVSFDGTIILFPELGILISCSVIFSIFINYYRNVYWFGISLFTLPWLAILSFGGSSKTIINLLFASQYNKWEGLFEVVKNYLPYTLLTYFGIALIISLSAYLFFLQQSRTRYKNEEV